MKEATFDPARECKMYFRCNRNGSKDFVVSYSGGTPYSFIYEEFTANIYRYEGEKKVFIPLIVSYNSNRLTISITSELSNVNQGEYYFELFNALSVQTWIATMCVFHNGRFDGVTNNTETLIVNTQGEVINITITAGGGSGTSSWGGITGDINNQSDLILLLNDKQDEIGYTPENQANKENTTLDTSTTKYPTNRLVKENVDNLQEQIDDIGVYTAQPPTIASAFLQGQTMVNKTITWSANAFSIDGYTISNLAYQHVYADDVNGTNKVTMVGETSASAVIPSGASGKYMGMEFTATDSNGGVTTETFYNSDQVSAAFYPLDSITGVKVCNMLKKPSSAFVGNAITLRATNGGTQYSYGFSGDDLDWTAISAQFVGSPAYEFTALDLSGNSNNRVHTNFTAEPQLDYVNRFIKWLPTKSGNNGAATSMDVGTGDFTVFVYCRINQILDNQLTVFSKQTAFNNAMMELQWSTYRFLRYFGATLKDNRFSGPSKWDLIMIGRAGGDWFFRTSDGSFSEAESAANITSSGNLNRNAGNNGGGDFDETCFIFAHSDARAHYDNLKKYLS